jgi:hypothetical protein
MYAAAFSPCTITRAMGMSSISANAFSMNAGTKKMCETCESRIISAKRRAPVVFGIATPPCGALFRMADCLGRA